MKGPGQRFVPLVHLDHKSDLDRLPKAETAIDPRGAWIQIEDLATASPSEADIDQMYPFTATSGDVDLSHFLDVYPNQASEGGARDNQLSAFKRLVLKHVDEGLDDEIFLVADGLT